MSNIAKRLEQVRRAQNKSQQQLAQMTGINRMTISKIENEQTDPRLSSIYELARALGMELMLIPKSIKPQLESIIRSNGRVVGQPEGVDAPVSIVTQLIKETRER